MEVDFGLLIREATTASQAGRFDDARACLEAAHAFAPRHPQPSYMLAELAEAAGADTTALELVLRALGWERKRPEPFVLAARVFAKLGHPALAARLAARAGSPPPVFTSAAAVPLERTLLDNFERLSRPPRLSVCMIVKDEAACLAACLTAARPHVDELVVLDTGSSDETMAIAQACGARVAAFTWVDDFAAARNASLEMASGDWVLVLDADEVLEAAPAALYTLIDGLPDPWLTGCVASVRVSLLHYLAENQKPGEAREVFLPRLFPRAFTRWEHAIHETPSVLVTPPEGALAPLAFERYQAAAIRLHHSGMLPAVIAARGKTARNMQLLRQRVAAAPGDFAARLYLADELLAAGDFAEAAATFASGWAMTPPGRHAELRGEVHQNWGLALVKNGQLGAALALVDDALAHLPTQGGLLALAGTALELLNRPQEAVARYLAAQAAGAQGLWAELATQGLARLPAVEDAASLLRAGLACSDAGEFARARQLLEQASALAPRHPQMHYQLAALAFKTGDLDAALVHVARSLSWERVRPEPFFLAGELADAVGHVTLATGLFAQAAWRGNLLPAPPTRPTVAPLLQERAERELGHWARPPRITLCLEVQGAAPHLARCLAGALPHVDEAVALVRGVDEATLALLHAHGVKVEASPGSGLAGAGWVLQLAPDELLEAPVGYLQRLLATLPDPRVLAEWKPAIRFPVLDGEPQARCCWRATLDGDAGFEPSVVAREACIRKL